MEASRILLGWLLNVAFLLSRRLANGSFFCVASCVKLACSASCQLFFSADLAGAVLHLVLGVITVNKIWHRVNDHFVWRIKFRALEFIIICPHLFSVGSTFLFFCWGGGGARWRTARTAAVEPPPAPTPPSQTPETGRTNSLEKFMVIMGSLVTTSTDSTITDSRDRWDKLLE